MKKVKNTNFTPISEYFFSDWHELNTKIKYYLNIKH